MSDKKTGKSPSPSGKPTRRTKSDAKPVTIDLEAEKVSTRSSVPKSGTKSSPKAEGARTASKSTTASQKDAPETAKSASTAADAVKKAKPEKKPADNAKAATPGKPSTSEADTKKSEAAKASGDKNANDSGFGRSSDKSASGEGNMSTASKGAKSAEKPAAPSEKTKRGAGFGSLLIAACLGALLALGGAWFAWQSGMLAPDNDASETDAAIQAAIAPLRARITELESRPIGVNAEEVDGRIEAALSEGDTTSTETDLQIAANAEGLEALRSRIGELQTEVSQVSDAVSSGSAGEDAGLAALSSRVTALSDQVEAVSTAENDGPANADVMASLSQQIEALGAADAQTRSAINAVKAQLEELASSSIGSSTLAASIAPIAEQLAALSARIADQQEAGESRAQDVARLAERLDDGAARRTAQALAAAALKSRVDEGTPFAAELETLQAVADDGANLEALAPFASEGVPTSTELAQRFAAIDESILNTRQPATPPEDASTMDRLLAGAKSLVKVRPIGPVEGDGTEAIVTRIRDAVQKGDLARASAEWQNLPDAAKDVSQEWHQALQARIKANGLLNETVRSFMMSTTQAR